MQILDRLKEVATPDELLKGNFGVERESLRCTRDGKLALTPHPKVFGEKLFNPYITTDFSESQVELITPAFSTLEETYNFLSTLYNITALEIEDEYLWPQSMPCIIPENEEIPIAQFCECPTGISAMDYRRKLLEKYGGKKQLLSGIHYNFSFDEALLGKLYDLESGDISYKAFKNKTYLKITRNYLRYRWLIIYLLGSTGIMHRSYIDGECIRLLDEVGEESFSNEGALSYRNSECGYNNEIELFPRYDTVENYVQSLHDFIEQGMIESPKELYSPIRLKAKDVNSLSDSLLEDGIHYLEYRSIDINPFDKTGISLEDLYFVHLFNLYLLIKDESDYEGWQQEAFINQRHIARFGQKDIQLSRDGEMVQKEKWGLEILEEMIEISRSLNLGKLDILDKMISRLRNPEETYAFRIIEKVKKEGYIEAHIKLAKEYKKMAYEDRFRLEGYEDMELSTQILIKEALKRGIKVTILDRKDQFIELSKGEVTHYIKQATKTAVDSYITVLMMENKVVTKKILEKHHIRVPKGGEFDSLRDAEKAVRNYVGMPIVVKPKSTNFGLGISIFPNGAKEAELMQAFEVAFQNDSTVLVEEFINGKEYRFLVIGDEVVGVLHRVPANVIGDGNSSIRELVEIKNEDPLRGVGYRTPLEKIKLDEPARLFLEQQGLNFDSIPAGGKTVYLRENSNISTGGDSIDYTDMMPEKFKEIAVAAAKAVEAKICGVDMMLENYSDEASSYGIIELNFNPAIHIHSYPYKGTERNIAEKVLNLLGFMNNKRCNVKK